MANLYMNLYTSATAGQRDGSAISLDGDQTSPLSVILDALSAESKVIPIGIRTTNGYTVDGDVTITLDGTSKAKWGLCATEKGTFSDTLTLTGVTSTNTIFYVKAAATTDETPTNDTSVKIKATGAIQAVTTTTTDTSTTTSTSTTSGS